MLCWYKYEGLSICVGLGYGLDRPNKCSDLQKQNPTQEA